MRVANYGQSNVKVRPTPMQEVLAIGIGLVINNFHPYVNVKSLTHGDRREFLFCL